jgi:hypothetical protein
VDLWKIEDLFFLLTLHMYSCSTYKDIKSSRGSLEGCRCFSFIELFILVFYVHKHITTSLHNENQTAKHTSQQQTITQTNHHKHSQPMVNTANTPCGGNRPPLGEKNDPESMANGGKGQKKRSASNDGNMVIKSHKQSSVEGDDDKNKNAGTNGAPGDGKRLMATNGPMVNTANTPRGYDRPPPTKNNDRE